MSTTNLLLVAVVLPLSVASIVLRYQRGDRVVRAAQVAPGGRRLPPAPARRRPSFDASRTDIRGWLAIIISISFIPIAIGSAILRYRLYEIDRIISRTLSYAVVTATLARLVGGCWAQSLLEPMTNENTIAVAASTLIVAALFQHSAGGSVVVDRRFNRARYDAQAWSTRSPSACATKSIRM